MGLVGKTFALIERGGSLTDISYESWTFAHTLYYTAHTKFRVILYLESPTIKRHR